MREVAAEVHDPDEHAGTAVGRMAGREQRRTRLGFLRRRAERRGNRPRRLQADDTGLLTNVVEAGDGNARRDDTGPCRIAVPTTGDRGAQAHLAHAVPGSEVRDLGHDRDFVHGAPGAHA